MHFNYLLTYSASVFRHFKNKNFLLKHLNFNQVNLNHFDVKTRNVDDKSLIEENLNLDFDFNEESCFNLKHSHKPFQYGEIVLCKFVVKSSKKYKIKNKLIKLSNNEVYRNSHLEIFHEHIVERSKKSLKSVSFNLFSSYVLFSRPSLYEYITLTEHTAVSSHYSIISLVPMLLEIGKNSRVLECGTGSGSMTLFLSERLGNSGLLHTFELTPSKVSRAKNHFHNWKNSYDLSAGGHDKWPANVKFGELDLTSYKFSEKYKEFYDSIYLDMAHLDKAIFNAYELLKLDGIVVVNALHLTQVIKLLNVIKENNIGFEHEIIMEPANRLWEISTIRNRKKKTDSNELLISSNEILLSDENKGSLDWTCRLEDRFVEKYKRGGLFFNYWSGFLVKLRKTK